MGRTIEADYLVVGAGAMGLAFIDTLVSETDATVVVVDRNDQPGGHWTTAYPFVRLHQPSAYYGVNSRGLGSDTIDHDGLNAGYYELASGAEVCAYFDAVMRQHLLPTGRVTYLPMSEYLGDGRVRTLGGEDIEVTARRVVTSHVEIIVPSMRRAVLRRRSRCRVRAAQRAAAHPRRPGSLRDRRRGQDRDGRLPVAAASRHRAPRLTWIKPRDSWILDRAAIQPGRQFAKRTLADFSGQLAAVHEAESLPDLFDRLEAKGCLLRIDASVDPTMYRCAILSQAELEAAAARSRTWCGWDMSQSIEPGRVTLEGGTLDIDGSALYIDCTADGFGNEEADSRLRRRPHLACRRCAPASRRSARPSSPTSKRRTPTTTPGTRSAARCRIRRSRLDWLRMMLAFNKNQLQWFSDPDMMAWVEDARLNVLHHVTAAVSERAREKIISMLTSQMPAINDKLETLLAQARAHDFCARFASDERSERDYRPVRPATPPTPGAAPRTGRRCGR